MPVDADWGGGVVEGLLDLRWKVQLLGGEHQAAEVEVHVVPRLPMDDLTRVCGLSDDEFVFKVIVREVFHTKDLMRVPPDVPC